ncbi:acyl-CoA thioesterase [Flavobacteriaceae bacterium]|nr:acyl-CoA thioesterase [Flavobacteriaceae bacterium]
MKKTTTKIRVRYAETDQMGFVHHGNYAQFFEIGRLDWITKIGVSYKNMESKGILLPVVFLETNYLKPAYYDDELIIETFLLEKPTSKIKFGYNIYNKNKDIITKGITHLAFMNKQSGKPHRCPKYLLDKIEINCYNM